MSKKSLVKKLLLEMYEGSIEEYVGASYVIDIVWGQGTSDRWTDKYDKKRKQSDNNTVITNPLPNLPEVIKPANGWVEEKGEYGVYWSWSDNPVDFKLPGIYVNDIDRPSDPEWEEMDDVSRLQYVKHRMLPEDCK